MEWIKKEAVKEAKAWGKIFMALLHVPFYIINKVLDVFEWAFEMIGSVVVYIFSFDWLPGVELPKRELKPAGSAALPVLPELPEPKAGVHVRVQAITDVATVPVKIMLPKSEPVPAPVPAPLSEPVAEVPVVKEVRQKINWREFVRNFVPAINLDVFLVSTLVLATFALGLAVLHHDIGPRGMSYTLRQAAGLFIILFNAVTFSDWQTYLGDRMRFDKLSGKFSYHPRVIWVALTAMGIAFLVGFEVKTAAFLTYIIVLVNLLGILVTKPASRGSYWLLMTVLASIIIFAFTFPLIFMP